jgi:catechol 2,3-dioxygenase-like lactoylglutathione lyase family enzyme
MQIETLEIGLVSAHDELFEFYVEVLGGERLEPRVFPFATVHRLGLPGVNLKVMVPAEAPAVPPAAARFSDVAGLRYLTLWVDDLEALVERWTAGGGAVTTPIGDLRPGVRFALLADPDGNAIEALEQRG